MVDGAEQHVRLLMIGGAPRAGAGWLRVDGPADALRRVRAANPRAVLLHIDRAAAAGACVKVLEELRRRRPDLALVVCASVVDDAVERSVRAAGAHCYVEGGPEPPPADVLARVVRPPEARANGPPAMPRGRPVPIPSRLLFPN